MTLATRMIVKSFPITKIGEIGKISVDLPKNAKKITGIGLTYMSGMPDNNYVYYGVAIAGGNDNAFIQTLTKKILESPVLDVFVVDAGIAEYIYYATPVRLATKVFTVNGFTGGFQNPITVSVIDAVTGYTEDYYLYRSNNPNLAVSEVEVTPAP